MSIWVSKVLCANRHAVLALALDDKEHAPDVGVRMIGQQFEQLVKRGAMLKKCHLCDATEFCYESSRTKFATIEEAEPYLKELIQSAPKKKRARATTSSS